MIQEIETLIGTYFAWLREKTVLRQVDEWIEITTPYLDRHNDYVQIYAKSDKSGFVLTDDGYTINDLEMGGCSLDGKKRQELLMQTINGFGVTLSNQALEVHCSEDSFPLRKHNLVQAMLAVNDLFCLAQPVIASLFYEDVVKWLDDSGIRYTPKVKFTGKSGFDYLFDFVIPKSKSHPERIIKAITRPDKRAAKNAVFDWVDTKHVRPCDSRAYAILNDSENKVPSDVLDALTRYDVHPIIWSQRESILQELAA